jgi:hypothetical protein
MVDATICHNFNFDYYGSFLQGPFLGDKFWWAPLKLRKTMEQQGWKGPKFCIFVGNMPEIFKFRKGELSKDLGIRDFDIMSRVYPQYVLFSKKYGKSNH